ncbi:MAG: XdhC family protein, partial [Candidatus Bipolaricaulota bacterium]|nr:XdhC family protein [Candidatus Bipolaricaulota bacterium]
VLEYVRGYGFSEEELSVIRSPAGLDLGAKTPQEIALSILSEIVALRHSGTAAPLSTIGRNLCHDVI